ncbi:hypothetical protein ACEN9J_01945 [Variovorax sp. Varisp41]|uniref:hypothetical protein n=1 Tax=Variovorax sp. Varisp41 TaxID=3243033 RepID=UPI0039B54E3D
MLKRLLALAMLATALVGCTTAPPVPPDAGKLPKGAKVGLLVNMPAPAQHMHVGTTVFTNFATSHQFPWNPTSRTYDIFTADLERAGFQVVRLTNYATTSVNALAVSQNDGWRANPAQAWATQKLKEQQIAAVVVVEGKRTLTRMECSGGPCAESHMANSGLFTRSMLGSTRYFAVPAMEAKVFAIAPPIELSAYEPLKTLQAGRVRQLKDFAEPKDFNQLNQAEFQPVVTAIDAHIAAISRATVQALVNGAK